MSLGICWIYILIKHMGIIFFSSVHGASNCSFWRPGCWAKSIFKFNNITSKEF